jgi:hypothetical protein
VAHHPCAAIGDPQMIDTAKDPGAPDAASSTVSVEHFGAISDEMCVGGLQVRLERTD